MGALEGRVALVTGSSRGIGAAIARLFAREGARVCVHGRDVAAIREVQEDIGRAGGTAIGVRADVTRFADIEALRGRVEGELGPIDVLVANAGGNLTDPGLSIEDVPEDGWRASLEANLTATFLCAKSVLPGMKSRGSGSIVTMSSAAACRAHARSPVPYAAAKAGIEMLTRSIAAQAGPFGVRANCIAPETIMTERNEQDIPAEYRESLVNQHPIRRLGTTDDVARAALFLASDASSWISGVVLDIAGGAVMR